MAKAEEIDGTAALGPSRLVIPTEADVFDLGRLMPTMISDPADEEAFLSIAEALASYRISAKPLKITKQVNGYLKSLDIRRSDYLQKAAIISAWAGRPFSGADLRNAVTQAVEAGRHAVFAHLVENEPILGEPFRMDSPPFKNFEGEPEPTLADYATLLRWALQREGIPINRSMVNSIENFISGGMQQSISAAQCPLITDYYQRRGRDHPGQSVPLFFGMSMSSEESRIVNQKNLQFELAAKVIVAFRAMTSWQRAGTLSANLQDEYPEILDEQLQKHISETLDLDKTVLAGIADGVLAREAGIKIELEFDFTAWLSDLP